MADDKHLRDLEKRLAIANREKSEIEQRIGERWNDYEYEQFCRCCERIEFLEQQIKNKGGSPNNNEYCY